MMAEFNENIWAPWRMEYIRSLGADVDVDCGCFFCAYFEKPQEDRTHYVLWRTETALVLLNRFPYTNGHLLIAPKRHSGEPSDFPAEEHNELTRLIYDAAKVVRTAFNADGFNIGCNLGRCAGAGVPDHLHYHIVPRWNGDTNFMAVLGATRVIPDGLNAAYERLNEAARQLGFVH